MLSFSFALDSGIKKMPKLRRAVNLTLILLLACFSIKKDIVRKLKTYLDCIKEGNLYFFRDEWLGFFTNP